MLTCIFFNCRLHLKTDSMWMIIFAHAILYFRYQPIVMTGQTRMMMNQRVWRRTRTLKLTWTMLVFAPTKSCWQPSLWPGTGTFLSVWYELFFNIHMSHIWYLIVSISHWYSSCFVFTVQSELQHHIKIKTNFLGSNHCGHRYTLNYKLHKLKYERYKMKLN